jgi:hypothetical protein
MDPSLKLALEEVQRKISEEMHKKFSELDTKWEQRFTEDKVQRNDRIYALEDSVDKAFTEFDSWRPQVTSAVEDLKLQVSKLNKQVDRALLERSSDPGILDPPNPLKSATARPSAGFTADGPSGHRQDQHHRDHEFGTVFTQTQIPVKGTSHIKIPVVSPCFPFHSSGSADSKSSAADFHHFGRLPKLSFPKFESENPKLWISRCENYFEMYSVPYEKWVQVAVNYFEGPAARWLQAVERRVYKSSWHEFCALFLERFGRDEHDLLIRRMLHIKQTGSITEYISQFVELIDQLTAYESPADPRHYTMKFIDGLSPAIRSSVFLQRPKDLDTACTFAALQEEVSESSQVKDNKKSGISSSTHRSFYPLLAPPPQDKAKVPLSQAEVISPAATKV